MKREPQLSWKIMQVLLTFRNTLKMRYLCRLSRDIIESECSVMGFTSTFFRVKHSIPLGADRMGLFVGKYTAKQK